MDPNAEANEAARNERGDRRDRGPRRDGGSLRGGGDRGGYRGDRDSGPRQEGAPDTGAAVPAATSPEVKHGETIIATVV